MFLDFGTDELERGGPSEVLILIVGVAVVFTLIYLLAQLAEEAIKGGKWGYAKAALELGFFPGIFFAAKETGAWTFLAVLVWCAAYFYAEDKAARAKKAAVVRPKC